MAAKVLSLLALIAAVAYAADDCNCDPTTELEDSLLWDFFKKISSDQPAEPNNDRMDAVLPGELSPLIDCDCSERTETRKKRKILPEVSDKAQETDYSEESIEGLRTPKCAQGYVWLAIKCVMDERFLMDRK